jgi:hypothetical protein
MKPEDVVIGMTVRVPGDCDKCVVKSLPDADGKIEVKYSYSRTNHKYHVDEFEIVDLEAEKQLATEVQYKVNLATSALEQAFALLQEVKSNSEMHDIMMDKDLVDIAGLVNVLESNGWSSSPLYC